MKTAVGNAALAAEGTINPVDVDQLQVDFICKSFRLANEGEPDRAYAPLIIRRDNYRLPAGYANFIEIHGSYTKEVAEKAIFILKDSSEITDATITELVTDKTGMVMAIKFIKPIIRMRTSG